MSVEFEGRYYSEEYFENLKNDLEKTIPLEELTKEMDDDTVNLFYEAYQLKKEDVKNYQVTHKIIRNGNVATMCARIVKRKGDN